MVSSRSETTYHDRVAGMTALDQVDLHSVRQPQDAPQVCHYVCGREGWLSCRTIPDRAYLSVQIQFAKIDLQFQ